MTIEKTTLQTVYETEKDGKTSRQTRSYNVAHTATEDALKAVGAIFNTLGSQQYAKLRRVQSALIE